MIFKRLDTAIEVAKNNMRTANRRIADYFNKGIKSPFEDMLKNLFQQGKKYIKQTKDGFKLIRPRGMSIDEYNELIELQRELKNQPTAKQWEKIANSVGTDANTLTRALEHMSTEKEGRYEPWVDEYAIQGKVESKGDGLVEHLQKLIARYSGIEYTQEEEKDIFNSDGFSLFGD